MVKKIVLSLLTIFFYTQSTAGDKSSEWKILLPSYQSVTNAIPEAPHYKVRVFDLKSSRFFITTKHGGFLSNDNGATWHFIDMKLGDHREQYIDAFFLNSEKAWAWNSKEIVFSSDSGLNWKVLSVSPWSSDSSRRIIDLFFLDEKIGFIFSPWDIYRTIDGGRHWHKITTLPSMVSANTKPRIWFISQKEGYIIVNDYKIYKTENAGADWKAMFTGEKKIVNAFFYKKNGIVIEELGDTYITRNGGKTWYEGEVPDYLDPTSFQFNKKGEGIGIGSKCILYITNDWGQKWKIRDFQSELEECKILNEKTAKKIIWDGKSLDRFAIHWQKWFFFTNDRGKTWKRNVISAKSFWIEKNQRIIATNPPNQLLYSDDFGNSWEGIINLKEKIWGISINDCRNWTSKDIITTDAGKTWQKSPRICRGATLNFDYHYFGKGMETSKLSAGLIEGCNENLAEYTNKHLYLFPNKSIMVDHDTAIVFTWNDKESKFKMLGNILNVKGKNEKIEKLGPIYFGSEDCAIAFGIKIDKKKDIKNGIFYTSNGGKTWLKSKVEKADEERLPKISDLPQIEKKNGGVIELLSMLMGIKGIAKAGFYLEDCRTGWGIVGTHKKNWYVIRTSNGGKSWSVVNQLKNINLELTDIARRPLSIAFLNLQIGWISDGINLYKTTDGGANWIREILPVKSIDISKIVIDDGNAYLQAGGFVLINSIN